MENKNLTEKKYSVGFCVFLTIIGIDLIHFLLNSFFYWIFGVVVEKGDFFSILAQMFIYIITFHITLSLIYKKLRIMDIKKFSVLLTIIITLLNGIWFNLFGGYLILIFLYALIVYSYSKIYLEGKFVDKKTIVSFKLTTNKKHKLNTSL